MSKYLRLSNRLRKRVREEKTRADVATKTAQKYFREKQQLLNEIGRAREAGANDILNIEYLPMYIDQMVRAMGSQYGDQIAKYWQQYIRPVAPPRLDFRADVMFSREKILRVRIPAADFNVRIESV